MAYVRRVSGDAGQAFPLVLAVVALAAVALVGLGRLSAGAADAARARSAADAAALAGAADGQVQAAQVAAANGGTLEHFEQVGADVVVTVRVGTARAAARATVGLHPPP